MRKRWKLYKFISINLFLPLLLAFVIVIGKSNFTLNLAQVSPKFHKNVAQSTKLNTVEVKTAKEFLQAIRPNTLIRLKAGIYNLSQATSVKSNYLSWLEVYDGLEPQISRVNNLQILGEKGTQILIEPRYAWVLNFQNSQNVAIKNITFGHTDSGYCLGGVLSFSNSAGININRAILYGSGTTGMSLEKVRDLKFTNSMIRDCTYHLLQITNSQNIAFENSVFQDTGEFNLVNIYGGSQNVQFLRSAFINNWSSEYFPYLFYIEDKTQAISLVDSKVIGNRTINFINKLDNLSMKDNLFLDNQFTDFSDVTLQQMD